ncbi:TIGR03643 family protein [Pseudomethylobacillus aquaticus]|uniref:TIGR03643 family protein n=1 Tax=Pseudomethylobacillus aquaticus TaxID=2676064 RepID=A0A3N0V4A9_9PROT|nr:TIGR03643 family protein [Pseudomethylobacillus aquaticus]ROH87318.1 TIGR03643 family protein [Pseudomethylobacillus aquaticus]
MKSQQLTAEQISRVIEMAWEDRTPFEAIQATHGLSEAQVITLMRCEMKASSFRMWRARVSGRKTKHAALRSPKVTRAYCYSQYKPR